MRISDETLMAYADGELDTDSRAALEAAMANDPDLADAIALQHENRLALQATLHAAFDGALNEDMPERLRTAALRAAEPGANVAHLAPDAAPTRTKSSWSLPQWGAIAVSLLIGILLGRAIFSREAGAIVVSEGRMTAGAELNAALNVQSSGAIDRETGIQIGVSYLAKSGEYCRTFTLRDVQALTGLSCRRRGEWVINAVTPTKPDASGAYRMAGAFVPALILGLVEDTMAGDPLDAQQEADARDRAWQR